MYKPSCVLLIPTRVSRREIQGTLVHALVPSVASSLKQEFLYERFFLLFVKGPPVVTSSVDFSSSLSNIDESGPHSNGAASFFGAVAPGLLKRRYSHGNFFMNEENKTGKVISSHAGATQVEYTVSGDR